ncbi:hypothetical protein KY344_03780 [Candidatus Woesearchaeota archaeon]|nr:hypothetical protein [Candidatus Woesearchaeota archaeon]
MAYPKITRDKESPEARLALCFILDGVVQSLPSLQLFDVNAVRANAHL